MDTTTISKPYSSNQTISSSQCANQRPNRKSRIVVQHTDTRVIVRYIWKVNLVWLSTSLCQSSQSKLWRLWVYWTVEMWYMSNIERTCARGKRRYLCELKWIIFNILYVITILGIYYAVKYCCKSPRGIDNMTCRQSDKLLPHPNIAPFSSYNPNLESFLFRFFLGVCIAGQNHCLQLSEDQTTLGDPVESSWVNEVYLLLCDYLVSQHLPNF